MATHTPEEIYRRLPQNLRSEDTASDMEVIRWSLPLFTTDGKLPKGAPEAIRHSLDATSEKVRDAELDVASTWTNEFLPEAK